MFSLFARVLLEHYFRFIAVFLPRKHVHVGVERTEFVVRVLVRLRREKPCFLTRAPNMIMKFKLLQISCFLHCVVAHGLAVQVNVHVHVLRRGVIHYELQLRRDLGCVSGSLLGEDAWSVRSRRHILLHLVIMVVIHARQHFRMLIDNPRHFGHSSYLGSWGINIELWLKKLPC